MKIKHQFGHCKTSEEASYIYAWQIIAAAEQSTKWQVPFQKASPSMNRFFVLGINLEPQ